jgi:protein-tyrosine phosphatase
MRGFIDLHCHWVAGIDDGARTTRDSFDLLMGLREIGFDQIVATPHMRPGMFDNDDASLRRAYDATCAELSSASGLPELGLSSEHFFDDVVFNRFMEGQVLPYPGGHAALVEFPNHAFPTRVTHRFFDLRRRRIRPVLAHPERYEPVWRDPESLAPLLDGGALMLLDVAALAGKYGRTPRRVAEELLEEGYYYAACSDAHSARDVADVKKGIDLMFDQLGREDATFMLVDGPRSILEGRVDAP